MDKASPIAHFVSVAALAAASTAAAAVCGDQDIAVEFYSPRAARILKTPAGATFRKPFETRVAKVWDGTVTVRRGDVTVWSTGELEVRLDRKARTVGFWNAKGEKLFEESSAAEFKDAQYGEHRTLRPVQRFRLADGEGLYGLGDLQNRRLNQRGEHSLLTPRNVGDGIPYFASDRGYSVWWDNTSPTSVSDDPGALAFESESGEGVDYYFLYGGTGDGCVAEMRALTGDVPMFPRWAYGYWQSKERYKTPQETVGVVERYRKDGIPLDGIVQDWQYWGENPLWNAMEFTGRDWRDGNRMIARAHELNAKMIITVWQSFGPQTKGYRELSERGLLFPFDTWPASSIDAWPPRKDYPSGVRLCDNFSPVARDIYWNNMKRLWDAGMDGWWMDSTDPDHFAKKGDLEHMTAAGCPYRDVRNAYPVSATKGVYGHQRRETDRKRVFILTRGAGAGQQRFATSVWSGDIASSWDVLRRQIPGGLNYTVTGNPQFNSDIGGFFAGRYNRDVKGENNVNYRELYARWMQLGAFMPMMRSHGTDVPREIYLYGRPGEEIYDALVGALRMRYRLMPYIYSLAGHITKDRQSFMRPLWFDFPEDETAKNCISEYMMGDAILVAPVLKALYTTEDNRPVGEYAGWDRKSGAADGAGAAKADLNAPFAGAREHEVYLPAGTDWYDFGTGRRYAGGQTVRIEVTMRSMPCFVKAGGIVFLGPDVQFNGEKDWRALEVRIYPGRDGATAFYEDAFDSYDYEKGAWSEIPVAWDESARSFAFGARVGGYPEMLADRVFDVKVAGVGDFRVEYDGTPVRAEAK